MFSKFEYDELFPINFDTTKNQLSLFLSPSEITNLFCDLMNGKKTILRFFIQFFYCSSFPNGIIDD